MATEIPVVVHLSDDVAVHHQEHEHGQQEEQAKDQANVSVVPHVVDGGNAGLARGIVVEYLILQVRHDQEWKRGRHRYAPQDKHH